LWRPFWRFVLELWVRVCCFEVSWVADLRVLDSNCVWWFGLGEIGIWNESSRAILQLIRPVTCAKKETAQCWLLFRRETFRIPKSNRASQIHRPWKAIPSFVLLVVVVVE